MNFLKRQEPQAYPKKEMAKYRQRSLRLYRPNVASLARLAVRKWRSRTTTKQKSKNTSEPGVTNEYQVKTIYRRRRMPRYKKKKWVSFYKKTSAVIDSRLATKTMLINDAYDVTNVINEQTFSAYMLYGLYGQDKNGFAGNSDVARVLQNYPVTSTAIFKSAIMDMTLVNKGTISLEVDLYHVVFWKKNNDKNFDDTVTRAVAETDLTAGTTTLSLKTRGATPFDIPQIMRQTGMKILKKIKYFLGAGNCATYQIRDARNRRFPTSALPANLAVNEEFILPGWTQGIIVVHKPVAGFQNQAAPISIGCTRKYAYATMESSNYEGGLD